METQLQEAIERIQYMESLFDTLQQAVQEDYTAIQTHTVYKEALAILTQYYENGLWLSDYELDEQNLLPPSLKRGVLSQDGLYDFLSDINEQ